MAPATQRGRSGIRTPGSPADKLPIAKMKVPPGFKVEIFAAEVFDARGLRCGSGSSGGPRPSVTDTSRGRRHLGR